MLGCTACTRAVCCEAEHIAVPLCKAAPGCETAPPVCLLLRTAVSWVPDLVLDLAAYMFPFSFCISLMKILKFILASGL